MLASTRHRPSLRGAFLLCAGSLVLTGAHAQSLEESQAGRTYVIAFPDTIGNLTDPRYPSPLRDTFALYIYSDVDNSCTITGVGYRRDVTLAAGTFTTVYLDDSAHASNDITAREIGTVSRSTFRIDAVEPVLVICYMATKFGAEAWSPLPVERWGGAYATMTMPGTVIRDVLMQRTDFSLRNRMAPARLLVVAAFDETLVTIHGAYGLHRMPDTAVTLNAGQTYQLESIVDTATANAGVEQVDLSGRMITANRPIGVLSGNPRYNLTGHLAGGLSQNSMSNSVYEWLDPIEQHGTEFVYLPTRDGREPASDRNGRRVGEVLRLIGTGAGTVRFSFNSGRPPIDVARGTVGEVWTTDGEAIVARSDAPGEVMTLTPEALYYSGGWFPGPDERRANYRTWGPFGTTLTPREQWVSFAPVIAPAIPDSMEHFLTVVTDSTSASSVRIDGSTAFEFNHGRIVGTDLVWGTIRLEPGTFTAVIGLDGTRFSGSVCGLRRGLEHYEINRTYDTNQYREIVALSYGYPLAPAHRQLREPTQAPHERAPNGIELDVAVDRSRLRMHYSLPVASSTRVDVVGVRGDVVATIIETEVAAGPHSSWLSTTDLTDGTYFVRLTANGEATVRRVVVW
jgi:hypothetical protein